MNVVLRAEGEKIRCPRLLNEYARAHSSLHRRHLGIFVEVANDDVRRARRLQRIEECANFIFLSVRLVAQMSCNRVDDEETNFGERLDVLVNRFAIAVQSDFALLPPVAPSSKCGLNDVNLHGVGTCGN